MFSDLVFISLMTIVGGMIVLAAYLVRTFGSAQAGHLRGALLALATFVAAVATLVHALVGTTL